MGPYESDNVTNRKDDYCKALVNNLHGGHKIIVTGW